MSFLLKVRFSGICAFVPNLNSGSADRICIVMPGGEDSFALDEEKLCPHRSFFELAPGSATEVQETLLRNYRVNLDFDPLDSPLNPDVQMLIGAPPGPRLAEMASVLGNHAITDPGIVSPNPPRVVATQIYLSKGTLSLKPGGDFWDIDPMPSLPLPPVRALNLVHEVVLTLQQLTRASIQFIPLGGATSRDPVDLTPRDGVGDVIIRMVNTCSGAERPQHAQRDRDFKWYYELLIADEKTWIKESLGSGELPFPRVAAAKLDNGPNV